MNVLRFQLSNIMMMIPFYRGIHHMLSDLSFMFSGRRKRQASSSKGLRPKAVTLSRNWDGFPGR